MSLRGEAFWVYYTALDGDNLPLSGDLANHTVYWSADGDARVEAENNQGGAGKHIEIGGGVYAVLVTTTEADCDGWSLTGVSSTTDAVIVPRTGNMEGVLAATIDGVDMEKLLQLLLASAVNVTTRNLRHNRVEIYARDGTTLLATITYDPARPGEITHSVIH